MSERSRSPAEVRPKRGIRGGAAARRKREAYLRHQEALGYDRNKVGIVHAGGLARPLYTPCTWEPESTTDEESVEFVDPEGLQQNLVDIVDLEAPAPLLPLSRPTPETVLLKARPKGPKQPSYPPPKPAGPKQPDYPPPAKGSLGVRPSSSSSATSSVPKPSVAPKVAIRPAVPRFQRLLLHLRFQRLLQRFRFQRLLQHLLFQKLFQRLQFQRLRWLIPHLHLQRHHRNVLQ